MTDQSETIEENAEVSAEEMTDTRRDDKAINTIHQYMAGAMVAGIVPIPWVDLAATTGIQLKMLHSLSRIYDVEFKSNIGKSAISSLLGSSAAVASSAPLAASISKLIPVIGHVGSSATLILLNGASTYAVGKVFQQHFASGGTFLSFDPEKVRGYFSEQYEKGKIVVSNLRGKEEAAPEAPQTSA